MAMTDKTRIPTNLRTLLILEVLGNSDTPMTPTEINQHIGLPKQTIHRLIATLEDEGFLIRDTDKKRYRPSRRLRQIGTGLLHASRSNITRHQILREVANQVNEAVNFVVPTEAGMRYLDRIDTDWPFRIQLPVGTDVPFHCTASGKTFMSSLTKRSREKFVHGLELEKRTEKTRTTPEALLEDLRICNKRGYALDDEEFMNGMVAIAVPIKDERGRFAASLAFHGPSVRLSTADAEAQIDVLLNGAKKLSDLLFN